MPHVDDGTLHALLDGALRAEDPARADVVEAHLETCPDCRALRDHAAALRAGAADILRALEPDARPDFQEVLTRAGHAADPAGEADGYADDHAGAPIVAGAAARPRGRARTTRAVAWAATIVLALGTGYLMRDLVGPEPTSRAVSDPDRPATEAGDGTAVETGAGRQDLARDLARADEEPSVAEGRTALPEARPPAAPAAPAPQARAAMDATEAAEVTGAAGAAEVATAAEEDVAIEGDTTLDIPAAPVALAGETVTPTVERTAAAAAPSRFVPQQATEAATATDRSIVLRGASVMATREDAMVGQARLETEGWTAATLAEARAVMDGTVYVLPGAEIVRILVRNEEIRTLQRVDGGIELLVTQRHATDGGPLGAPVPAGAAGARLRADADAAEHAMRADAAEHAGDERVARALHDRFWIIVAGPVPVEAVQILADRARPLDDEPRQR
jgi:hypothetical protein